jgi:hypothetical protein
MPVIATHPVPTPVPSVHAQYNPCDMPSVYPGARLGALNGPVLDGEEANLPFRLCRLHC